MFIFEKALEIRIILLLEFPLRIGDVRSNGCFSVFIFVKPSTSISRVSFANCLSLTGTARTRISISLTRIVAVVNWMAPMHGVYFMQTPHGAIPTLSCIFARPRVRVRSQVLLDFRFIPCLTDVALAAELRSRD